MRVMFQVEDWCNCIHPLLHSVCYIHNRIQSESMKNILQHIFHYLSNNRFQHTLQHITFYKYLNRRLGVNCNSSIVSWLDQNIHYNSRSITGIFHRAKTIYSGIPISTFQGMKLCLLYNLSRTIHQKIRNKYHSQYYHRKIQARIKFRSLLKKKQAGYHL